MTVRFVAFFAGGMFALGAGVVSTDTLSAQDASRPVRVITAEAGGGSDLPLRVIAQALAAEWKRPVVIDNRGGGVIGPEIVARSPPDGNTMLFYGNTVWLLPLMRSKMNYDPHKDLIPTSLGIVTPTMLVVHPSVPVSSVKDLIALAKAKVELNYASAATGTGNHMAAELFKYMAGVNLVRVAYKGHASALTATMTGETQVFFPVVGPGMQAVNSGKVKALGVTTSKPTVLAPGLPTVASAANLPGYESLFRAGFFLPAGTPANVVDQMSRDIARVTQRADIKEKLFTMGNEAFGSTPQEFAATIKSEVSVMGKVIKQANIRDE